MLRVRRTSLVNARGRIREPIILSLPSGLYNGVPAPVAPGTPETEIASSSASYGMSPGCKTDRCKRPEAIIAGARIHLTLSHMSLPKTELRAILFPEKYKKRTTCLAQMWSVLGDSSNNSRLTHPKGVPERSLGHMGYSSAIPF